jgi:ferrous iron transport protein A
MNNSLDKAKKGELVKVIRLPGGDLKIQLIRLGIIEGDTVIISERLPGGTIVLKKNRQEIAMGFELAKKIKIIVQN